MRRKPQPQKSPAPVRSSTPDLWIYIALLVAILGVYAQAGSHDFVDYDDRIYVGDNHHVRYGFSWDGFKWAFTSLDDSNWFPLTRLSHMLDCQLFGLDAGLQHWTNILLHAIGTLLLFAILKRMTGGRWPSAFVAFAFALHPLHVESVAWIAERKDVLSALFWFLTIWAYLNYVDRPSTARYLGVVATFVCGLMSKPMIVTMPFALLLLDYWPLGRLKARAVWEKLPLIALSMAASAVTFFAQNQGQAVAQLARFPLGLRVENAIISYSIYLEKFFWPSRLAVFYPYPGAFPAWQWILAALVLAAITAAVFTERDRRPYLIVGWLWFLGTLLPVIGLVQVGVQARADRYTYVPMIGISIMIAWLSWEMFAGDRFRGLIVVCGAAAAVIWCVLTWKNLENWQNTETLFTHALQVTDGNFVAYNNLGTVLRREGRFSDAVLDFQSAVNLQPQSPEAQDNLGEALITAGRIDEAVPHLQEAIRLDPRYAKAHLDLGSALIPGGHAEEAAGEFAEALRLDPENRDAEYRLGGALMMEGRAADAMPHFFRALPFLIDGVRRDPDDADRHYNLGEVYALMGRTDESIAEFSTAVRLRPDDPEAHLNLGVALFSAHRAEAATEQFFAATHLRPDYVRAHFELARALESMGRRPEAEAELIETLKLAPGFAAARQELDRLK